MRWVASLLHNFPTTWNGHISLHLIVCAVCDYNLKKYFKETIYLRFKLHHFNFESNSFVAYDSGIIRKYGFCNKSFRKDETLTSWTLLQHICPHFGAWLLLYSAITPQSEDKYVEKVFNSTELYFSEVYFFQNWYFRLKSIITPNKEHSHMTSDFRVLVG